MIPAFAQWSVQVDFVDTPPAKIAGDSWFSLATRPSLSPDRSGGRQSPSVSLVQRPGRFRLPDGTDHRMCDVKPTRSVRRRLPHCPAGQLFLHRLRSKGTRSLNRCQEVVELSATCRFIPPMKSGGFHGLISVKRRSVRRSHNINARLRERSYATSEKRPS